MYNIIEIFPTPVYQSVINKNVLDACVSDLESLCEKYIVGKDYYNNNHKLDIDRRSVLNKFPELKAEIQSHLDLFVSDVIGEKSGSFKLYITSSWCAGVLPGGSQPIHIHENSIVSGVIYFNNEANVSDISFVRENSVAYNPHLNLNPHPGSKFSKREFKITPRNGSIILFPSYIKHKVLEHTGDKRRNCLAFDSFVSGSIGDRRTILTL